MRTLIQSIFLNDLAILLLMMMAVLLLTSWAFRYRQYTAYTLGLLIGVFFIVTFGSMVSPASIVDTADPEYARLSLPTVIFAAFFGFITSIVIMGVIQFLVTYTATTLATWLTVVGMGLTIGSGYLMLITSDSFRLIIAIFVLALTIAMLVVMMFYPRRPYVPVDGEMLVEDELGANSSTVDQIRRLQQRFQQQSQREPYL